MGFPGPTHCQGYTRWQLYFHTVPLLRRQFSIMFTSLRTSMNLRCWTGVVMRLPGFTTLFTIIRLALRPVFFLSLTGNNGVCNHSQTVAGLLILALEIGGFLFEVFGSIPKAKFHHGHGTIGVDWFAIAKGAFTAFHGGKRTSCFPDNFTKYSNVTLLTLFE